MHPNGPTVCYASSIIIVIHWAFNLYEDAMTQQGRWCCYDAYFIK